jgi:PAS domain S-box-containing protein
VKPTPDHSEHGKISIPASSSKFSDSIRTRLIRYFLIVVLIPALIIPLISLIYLYREYLRDQAVHHVAVAEQQSRFIENLIESRATEALVISQLPEIRRVANAQTPLERSTAVESLGFRLETYALHHREFISSIGFYDLKGESLIHVSSDKSKPTPDSPENVADRSWFVGANHLAAIRGKRLPVYYDQNGPDEPVRFSTTVQNDQGILFGVLLLEMNMESLYAQVNPSGKQDLCVILNEKGEPLANSIQKPDCPMLNEQVYQSIITQNKGTLTQKKLFPDRAFVFSRIQPKAQSAIRWTVMYQYPLTGTFANIRKTLNFLILTSGICILIALAVSMKLSGQITRPLQKLSTAAHDICQGYWDAEMPLLTHWDEVAFLTQSFSSMCRQLKSSQESLLQKVEDLESSRKSYAREKERLSVTLKSIGDAVIATDLQGNIQLANPVAEKLLGMSFDNMVDLPLEQIVHFMDPDSNEEITSIIEHATGQHLRFDSLSELRMVNSKGTEVLIEHSVNPIHDPESHVIGTVLVLRNVSEVRKVQEEQNRIERLESLGILAGGIAHDFNNLLAVILGDLSLLQLWAENDPSSKEQVEHATQATNRAKDLTRQLLTFSKGGSPIKEKTSLPELIEESIKFALHGSTCSVNIEVEKPLWTAEVDEGQIHQVFHNLTLNAIQAMPEGGNLSIRLANCTLKEDNPYELTPGSYIRIEFTDTGKGIPAKDLSKIFDPYYTTKQVGSGLGLSSVHSIVSSHDGHIHVKSSKLGSTFIVYLPSLSETLAPKNEKTGEDKPEPPPTTAHILLLDDEPGILMTSRKILEHYGHTVDTSEEGETTIQKYKDALNTDNPFDLLILDLTIPGGKGGKEVITELRKIDPNVKAIVSSGYSQDQAMANYRTHGFKGVLQKPYSLAELDKTIKAVLNGQQ